PELTLDIDNIAFGDNLVVRNTLDSNLTYDLILEIDNRNYTIQSNSEYVLPVVLDVATYNAILYFKGDGNYNKCNTSAAFLVTKHVPNLTLDIENITYGDYLVVINTLDNNLTYDLTLEINNKNYIIRSNSTYKIPDLFDAGVYDVILTFAGDNNYNSTVQKTKVLVDKYAPNLSFDIDDVDYGEYISSNIKLTGFDGLLLNENVVLTINNQNYTFSTNNEFIIPILLNASNYPVSVNFKGNGNYNNVSKTANVNVNKINPKIYSTINSVMYGENTVVWVNLTGLNNELINDDVVLTVDNEKYSFKANRYYTLPVFLNVSNYEAIVLFNGNNNYNSVNDTVQFSVYKNDLNVDLSVLNTTYGEKTLVNTCLTDFNGNLVNESLKLEIDGVNYTVDSNSEFVLPVVLNASSYIAYLYFEGNNNYNKCNASAAFFVRKSTPELTLDIDNIAFGDNLVVRNTLDSNLTYDLILEINNVNYTIQSNSEFVLPVVLAVAVYNAYLFFEGDNNYNECNVSTSFFVSKPIPKLTLDIDNITYGDNLVVRNTLETNLTCNLTLEINNRNYSIKSNSTFKIPDLFDAGVYDVVLTFDGDNNYNATIQKTKVSVDKYTPDLSLILDDVDYGEYISSNIKLTGLEGLLINENIVLTINNQNYTFMANNDFIVPIILNASNYPVNVYYKGNNNYNAVNKTVNVNVNRINPKIHSSINSVKYGENIIVEVNLTGLNDELINEGVVFTVNNNDYIFKANTYYTLPVFLNASNYEGKVIFNGNNNYNSVYDTVQFVVYKNDLNISLDVLNITYGETTLVNTYLTDFNGNLVNEILKLEINGVNYTINSNSEFVLPAVLNASNYKADLYFEGNNNYNKCNAYAVFLVSKFTPELTLDIDNITYGDNLVVKNTLESDFAYDLILEINNRSYTIKSNSTFKISDLFDAGVYDVVLTFGGDNNYNATIQKTKVSVDKYTPDLSLDIEDIDYGEYISSLIKLTGINDSKLNENVVLTIDSKNYLLMANNEFIIPILLNASNYPVNIYFKGNENYNEVNKTVNVNVNKINPKLVLNISDTAYDEDIIINNYLTGFNGENIQETLTLIINNKQYYVNSNNAYVLPDKLDLGTYVANLVFNGNSNYNKINASLTFEIYLNELNMDLNISKHVNDINITINLSKKLNESIDVKINNRIYKVETIDGEATLSLNNLELGQYSLEALFNKTSYKPVLIKDEFIIDTIYSLINAIDIEMYYHDGTRLHGRLTDSNNNSLANKEINVYINNVKYGKTTDSNGGFSIGLNLNSGKYLTNIEFIGDNVYINSSREILVNIKPTLDMHNLTKYYRNSSQFYAKILDFNANPVANTQVMMNINGVFYTRTTDFSGLVKLNINLQPGKYILTVYNPVTGEQSSCLITVLSRLVENHDLVKYYRNASKYSVKVLDEKGSPLSGAEVKFNINGVFYTRISDINGVASLSINLNPGTYTITAEYDSSMVSNTIKVLSTIKAEDMVMKYR
ncbi:carboxypeptidase-like regulatory domain-containing protein, partial [Methanobrevibacter sp.]|uniref:carboxypeptidase-like regulatory domain-containing protein n=1 Tax=Methanobrevibacter sp. TaxID=66852 RepID=UPI00388CF106